MAVSRLRLLKAILLLPGNAVVLVPAVLLYIEGEINPGWGLGEYARWGAVDLGLVFLGAGMFLGYWTVSLFMREGQGTPAPWDPPRRLVIKGPYRHVRNPMITGAILILIGEGLVTGSVYVLCWAALFFLANNIWFIAFEEPGLERRFGEKYRAYRRSVPRWLPRMKPFEDEG